MPSACLPPRIADALAQLRAPGGWSAQWAILLPELLLQSPQWPPQRGLAILQQDGSGPVQHWHDYPAPLASDTDAENDVCLLRRGVDHYVAVQDAGIRDPGAGGDSFLRALGEVLGRDTSASALAQWRCELADFFSQHWHVLKPLFESDILNSELARSAASLFFRQEFRRAIAYADSLVIYDHQTAVLNHLRARGSFGVAEHWPELAVAAGLVPRLVVLSDDLSVAQVYSDDASPKSMAANALTLADLCGPVLRQVEQTWFSLREGEWHPAADFYAALQGSQGMGPQPSSPLDMAAQVAKTVKHNWSQWQTYLLGPVPAQGLAEPPRADADMLLSLKKQRETRWRDDAALQQRCFTVEEKLAQKIEDIRCLRALRESPAIEATRQKAMAMQDTILEKFNQSFQLSDAYTAMQTLENSLDLHQKELVDVLGPVAALSCRIGAAELKSCLLSCEITSPFFEEIDTRSVRRQQALLQRADALIERLKQRAVALPAARLCLAETTELFIGMRGKAAAHVAQRAACVAELARPAALEFKQLTWLISSLGPIYRRLAHDIAKQVAVLPPLGPIQYLEVFGPALIEMEQLDACCGGALAVLHEDVWRTLEQHDVLLKETLARVRERFLVDTEQVQIEWGIAQTSMAAVLALTLALGAAATVVGGMQGGAALKAAQARHHADKEQWRRDWSAQSTTVDSSVLQTPESATILRYLLDTTVSVCDWESGLPDLPYPEKIQCYQRDMEQRLAEQPELLAQLLEQWQRHQVPVPAQSLAQFTAEQMQQRPWQTPQWRWDAPADLRAPGPVADVFGQDGAPGAVFEWLARTLLEQGEAASAQFEPVLSVLGQPTSLAPTAPPLQASPSIAHDLGVAEPSVDALPHWLSPPDNILRSSLELGLGAGLSLLGQPLLGSVVLFAALSRRTEARSGMPQACLSLGGDRAEPESREIKRRGALIDMAGDETTVRTANSDEFEYRQFQEVLQEAFRLHLHEGDSVSGIRRLADDTLVLDGMNVRSGQPFERRLTPAEQIRELERLHLSMQESDLPAAESFSGTAYTVGNPRLVQIGAVLTAAISLLTQGSPKYYSGVELYGQTSDSWQIIENLTPLIDGTVKFVLKHASPALAARLLGSGSGLWKAISSGIGGGLSAGFSTGDVIMGVAGIREAVRVLGDEHASSGQKTMAIFQISAAATSFGMSATLVSASWAASAGMAGAASFAGGAALVFMPVAVGIALGGYRLTADLAIMDQHLLEANSILKKLRACNGLLLQPVNVGTWHSTADAAASAQLVRVSPQVPLAWLNMTKDAVELEMSLDFGIFDGAEMPHIPYPDEATRMNVIRSAGRAMNGTLYQHGNPFHPYYSLSKRNRRSERQSFFGDGKPIVEMVPLAKSQDIWGTDRVMLAATDSDVKNKRELTKAEMRDDSNFTISSGSKVIDQVETVYDKHTLPVRMAPEVTLRVLPPLAGQENLVTLELELVGDGNALFPLQISGEVAYRLSGKGGTPVMEFVSVPFSSARAKQTELYSQIDGEQFHLIRRGLPDMLAAQNAIPKYLDEFQAGLASKTGSLAGYIARVIGDGLVRKDDETGLSAEYYQQFFAQVKANTDAEMFSHMLVDGQPLRQMALNPSFLQRAFAMRGQALNLWNPAPVLSSTLFTPEEAVQYRQGSYRPVYDAQLLHLMRVHDLVEYRAYSSGQRYDPMPALLQQWLTSLFDKLDVTVENRASFSLTNTVAAPLLMRVVEQGVAYTYRYLRRDGWQRLRPERLVIEQSSSFSGAAAPTLLATLGAPLEAHERGQVAVDQHGRRELLVQIDGNTVRRPYTPPPAAYHTVHARSEDLECFRAQLEAARAALAADATANQLEWVSLPAKGWVASRTRYHDGEERAQQQLAWKAAQGTLLTQDVALALLGREHGWSEPLSLAMLDRCLTRVKGEQALVDQFMVRAYAEENMLARAGGDTVAVVARYEYGNDESKRLTGLQFDCPSAPLRDVVEDALKQCHAEIDRVTIQWNSLGEAHLRAFYDAANSDYIVPPPDHGAPLVYLGRVARDPHYYFTRFGFSHELLRFNPALHERFDEYQVEHQLSHAKLVTLLGAGSIANGSWQQHGDGEFFWLNGDRRSVTPIDTLQGRFLRVHDQTGLRFAEFSSAAELPTALAERLMAEAALQDIRSLRAQLPLAGKIAADLPIRLGYRSPALALLGWERAQSTLSLQEMITTYGLYLPAGKQEYAALVQLLDVRETVLEGITMGYTPTRDRYGEHYEMRGHNAQLVALDCANGSQLDKAREYLRYGEVMLAEAVRFTSSSLSLWVFPNGNLSPQQTAPEFVVTTPDLRYSGRNNGSAWFVHPQGQALSRAVLQSEAEITQTLQRLEAEQYRDLAQQQPLWLSLPAPALLTRLGLRGEQLNFSGTGDALVNAVGERFERVPAVDGSSSPLLAFCYFQQLGAVQLPVWVYLGENEQILTTVPPYDRELLHYEGSLPLPNGAPCHRLRQPSTGDLLELTTRDSSLLMPGQYDIVPGNQTGWEAYVCPAAATPTAVLRLWSRAADSHTELYNRGERFLVTAELRGHFVLHCNNDLPLQLTVADLPNWSATSAGEQSDIVFAKAKTATLTLTPFPRAGLEINGDVYANVAQLLQRLQSYASKLRSSSVDLAVWADPVAGIDEQGVPLLFDGMTGALWRAPRVDGGVKKCLGRMAWFSCDRTQQRVSFAMNTKRSGFDTPYVQGARVYETVAEAGGMQRIGAQLVERLVAEEGAMPEFLFDLIRLQNGQSMSLKVNAHLFAVGSDAEYINVERGEYYLYEKNERTRLVFVIPPGKQLLLAQRPLADESGQVFVRVTVLDRPATVGTSLALDRVRRGAGNSKACAPGPSTSRAQAAGRASAVDVAARPLINYRMPAQWCSRATLRSNLANLQTAFEELPLKSQVSNEVTKYWVQARAQLEAEAHQHFAHFLLPPPADVRLVSESLAIDDLLSGAGGSQSLIIGSEPDDTAAALRFAHAQLPQWRKQGQSHLLIQGLQDELFGDGLAAYMQNRAVMPKALKQLLQQKDQALLAHDPYLSPSTPMYYETLKLAVELGMEVHCVDTLLSSVPNKDNPGLLVSGRGQARTVNDRDLSMTDAMQEMAGKTEVSNYLFHKVHAEKIRSGEKFVAIVNAVNVHTSRPEHQPSGGRYRVRLADVQGLAELTGAVGVTIAPRSVFRDRPVLSIGSHSIYGSGTPSVALHALQPFLRLDFHPASVRVLAMEAFKRSKMGHSYVILPADDTAPLSVVFRTDMIDKGAGQLVPITVDAAGRWHPEWPAWREPIGAREYDGGFADRASFEAVLASKLNLQALTLMFGPRSGLTTSLSGATYLRGSELTNVSLRDVNNMRGADLRGANWQSVTINAATDFSGALFDQTRMSFNWDSVYANLLQSAPTEWAGLVDRYFNHLGNHQRGSLLLAIERIPDLPIRVEAMRSLLEKINQYPNFDFSVAYNSFEDILLNRSDGAYLRHPEILRFVRQRLLPRVLVDAEKMAIASPSAVKFRLLSEMLLEPDAAPLTRHSGLFNQLIMHAQAAESVEMQSLARSLADTWWDGLPLEIREFIDEVMDDANAANAHRSLAQRVRVLATADGTLYAAIHDAKLASILEQADRAAVELWDQFKFFARPVDPVRPDASPQPFAFLREHQLTALGTTEQVFSRLPLLGAIYRSIKGRVDTVSFIKALALPPALEQDFRAATEVGEFRNKHLDGSEGMATVQELFHTSYIHTVDFADRSGDRKTLLPDFAARVLRTYGMEGASAREKGALMFGISALLAHVSSSHIFGEELFSPTPFRELAIAFLTTAAEYNPAVVPRRVSGFASFTWEDQLRGVRRGKVDDHTLEVAQSCSASISYSMREHVNEKLGELEQQVFWRVFPTAWRRGF
ncbi:MULTISPECIES: hypothetical protein [unclassified Undibacterium]|uniref:hypothetical protein n=1 Tax=unclassified Undibacterium TaxID=2630295 RepID=UPI002AC9A49C|nr:MULTISPECIES: hypothetical protein [unclassified Undibacterium]MEB0140334.1 hypothetical protein [Undibacterium sp. CCC2.1]MEB0172343.1 hypothetical protein [Undibacterium sp. CCC1.1]MEB0176259.1 hypothetical protein [Undibacterium sp. CCC3.4]MEB0215501.1 hypothetical protein [Undibacterium sp. 5I2]WPX44353.1 hypothetical protein RHM61_03735 [Undibacterium sp. CCC3.4]